MSYTYEEEQVLMKDGDYEVVIEKIERNVLPVSGKEKLHITYRVRSDVDQGYKNFCVFEDIWQEKDNPEYFNRRRINKLLGTQDVQEGTVFEEIDDIIKFLVGSSLIVNVKIVRDDYRGRDVNIVYYYKPSNFKPQVMSVEDKVVEVKDEDLPF